MAGSTTDNSNLYLSLRDATDVVNRYIELGTGVYSPAYDLCFVLSSIVVKVESYKENRRNFVKVFLNMEPIDAILEIRDREKWITETEEGIRFFRRCMNSYLISVRIMYARLVQIYDRTGWSLFAISDEDPMKKSGGQCVIMEAVKNDDVSKILKNLD